MVSFLGLGPSYVVAAERKRAKRWLPPLAIGGDRRCQTVLTVNGYRFQTVLTVPPSDTNRC